MTPHYSPAARVTRPLVSCYPIGTTGGHYSPAARVIYPIGKCDRRGGETRGIHATR